MLLALLELQDFFFDAVAANHFIGENVFVLPDAVGSVDGLLLHGGIPPGIDEENVVGGGEIEAGIARHEADEKDVAIVVFLLKTADHFLPLGNGRIAIEVVIKGALLLQTAGYEVQHAFELRKNEGFVASKAIELFHEHIEFYGIAAGKFEVFDQLRCGADLS